MSEPQESSREAPRTITDEFLAELRGQMKPQPVTSTDVGKLQQNSPSKRKFAWGTIAFWSIVLTAAAFMISHWLSERSAERSSQELAKTRAQKSAREIALLVVKHNAVTNVVITQFGISLSDPQTNFLDRPFSIEISRALVRADGRPVMFPECYLDDVYETNGHYVAVFNTSRLGGLRLEFECDPRLMNVLTEHRDTLFRQFAVVARCTSARRQTGENSDPLVRGSMLDAISVSSDMP